MSSFPADPAPGPAAVAALTGSEVAAGQVTDHDSGTTRYPDHR
ncbi:MAG: hypothetical protein ACR2FU_21445 [Streptosporangiaceae bacterium]